MAATHSDAETRSKAPIQVAVAILFLITTWLTLSLRMFVRARLLRSLWWDDLMMLISVVFFTIMAVSLLLIVHYQAAMRGPSNRSTAAIVGLILSWRMVTQAFYILSLCFLKISIGIFILRLANEKWQRRLVYAVMVVVSIISFCHIWIVVFFCGNPRDYRVNYATHKCMPKPLQIGFVYEYAAVNTITDWILAALPFYILLKSQMSRSAKVSVSLILTLGLLGSVGSIIRFFYVGGLSNANEAFWSFANIAIWSTVEPGMGITAGCLITLRPLFKCLKHKIQGTSDDSNDDPASDPSLYQWQRTSDHGHVRTTTTCVGGVDANLEGPTAIPMDDLGHRHGNSRTRMMDTDGAAGVPRDDSRILKAVNVEVHISQDGRTTGANTPDSVRVYSVPPARRGGLLGDDIV